MPEDRLWVRETYTILEPEHCEGMSDRVYYRSDHHESNEEWRLEAISHGYSYQWKPSIFMRKNHSRIWLEVTDIRIEQLQMISRQDAAAEGMCVEPGRPLPKGIQRNRFPEENFLS